MKHRLIFAGLALVTMASPPRAIAQLRPLEPLQWRLEEEHASLGVELGATRLFDQRASLAGTIGDLWEVGNFSLAWRTGRITLEAAGSAQRLFRETGVFDAPYPDVKSSDDGDRHDSGDYRISTAVRLTPAWFPVAGIVRFGTRLPTTDNETGLDRDALDFFATIGGTALTGPLAVAGEAGLGIHSSREDRFEQDDLLLYSFRLEYRAGFLTPSIAALGQKHGPSHTALRGLEDLGELRAGVRIGRRAWLRAEYVHGYETFSPSSGVVVTAGVMR